MPTAFGYTRVSSDRQVDQGVGLDVQDRDIKSHYSRHLAQAYTWGGVLSDPAVSGRLKRFAERDGGGRLLAKAGRGDCIVFHKLSRAFRTMADAHATIEALRARGIKVIFLDMGGSPVDMDTMVGKVVFTVMALAAEMEVEALHARFREARVFLKGEGRASASRPGFCLVNWRYGSGKNRVIYVVPDIPKRRVLAWIAARKRDGHSSQAIADHMNAMKVPHWSKPRHVWKADRLDQLHHYWNEHLKREAAVGADGETVVLMPTGEAWPLSRFAPVVRRKILTDIRVADEAWGVKKVDLDNPDGADYSPAPQAQEAV